MTPRNVLTSFMLMIVGLILFASFVKASLIGLLFLIPLVAAWILLDGVNWAGDVRHLIGRFTSDRRIAKSMRVWLRDGKKS